MSRQGQHRCAVVREVASGHANSPRLSPISVSRCWHRCGWLWCKRGQPVARLSECSAFSATSWASRTRNRQAPASPTTIPSFEDCPRHPHYSCPSDPCLRTCTHMECRPCCLLCTPCLSLNVMLGVPAPAGAHTSPLRGIDSNAGGVPMKI